LVVAALSLAPVPCALANQLKITLQIPEEYQTTMRRQKRQMLTLILRHSRRWGCIAAADALLCDALLCDAEMAREESVVEGDGLTDEATHKLLQMSRPLQSHLFIWARRVQFGVWDLVLGQAPQFLDLLVKTELPQLLLYIVRPSSEWEFVQN
jgi:hypothetical protein